MIFLSQDSLIFFIVFADGDSLPKHGGRSVSVQKT